MVGKSGTTVRYWLNKFELKTNYESIRYRKPTDYSDGKKCPKCNTKKPLNEFYDKRGKIGGSGYCKICTNNETYKRSINLKQKCVEYKGGCCEICGYNKSNSALQFHHLKPNEKKFNISEYRTRAFSDEIKKELDKCMLVCANCHFEIHDGSVA